MLGLGLAFAQIRETNFSGANRVLPALWGLPLACGRQVRVSLGYRVRVSRVVIETAKVAGTLVKSRGGICRTAAEVAQANMSPEGFPKLLLEADIAALSCFRK